MFYTMFIFDFILFYCLVYFIPVLFYYCNILLIVVSLCVTFFNIGFTTWYTNKPNNNYNWIKQIVHSSRLCLLLFKWYLAWTPDVLLCGPWRLLSLQPGCEGRLIVSAGWHSREASRGTTESQAKRRKPFLTESLTHPHTHTNKMFSTSQGYL